MARNVHLQPDAESALREAAARTGRSQQQLIREAIDEKLGISRELVAGAPDDAVRLNAQDRLGRLGITAAASPYRELADPIALGAGLTSGDLLDREDRD